MNIREAKEILDPSKIRRLPIPGYLIHQANGFVEGYTARNEQVRGLVEAAKSYKKEYFDHAENQDDLTDEAKAIIKALAPFQEGGEDRNA